MKKSYLKLTSSWVRVRMAVLLLAALLIADQSASASMSSASADRFADSGEFKVKGRSAFTMGSHGYGMSDVNMRKLRDRILRGKVVDETGEGLPGVSVQIKGTTVGAVTDAKGEYRLTMPGENGTIVFSFLGFTTVETVIGLSNTVNATMSSSQAALDEFVVVGYGTQRKTDVTGAIASVQAKDLIMTTSPDVGSLLKGKLSGLVVIQNSAQPGGGLNIQIRGATSVNASNSPLIIVDGFPVADLPAPVNGGRYTNAGSQSILNSINPNDIEAVTVLKDASATSIYGARAANGVILITTKSGSSGGKPNVTYQANSAVSKYNQEFDVFNLKDWMAESNRTAQESWDEANGVIPWGTIPRAQAVANPVNGLQPNFRYTQAQIDAAGEGTNWVDLITDDGNVQQHNLAVSGGSKASNYYLSGNFYDNQGVVKNAALKRYTFRMNYSQELSPFVKLGIQMTGSRQHTKNTQLGDTQFEASSLIKSAVDFSPAVQAIDANGKYPLNPEQGLRPNPYSILQISDNSAIERALINANLDIKPHKDLTVQVKAGLDRNTNRRNNYQPSTTFFGNLENGIAQVSQNGNNNLLYEVNTTYNKNFLKKHNVTALFGVSQQNFNNESTNVGSTGYITDAFLYNSIGSGSGTRTVGSGASESKVASYYARLFYSFDQKYMITMTARRDGASVFARNNKWANFPSASVAWTVSNESWFSSLKPVFSKMKLRLGWGQTGNSSIGNNAFAAYRTRNGWLSGTDGILTAVEPSRLENPDLKWETSTESNAGLEVSFFNDKIDVAVDFYNKKTTDLLDSQPLNSYNFINTVSANIGATQSKGFEIGLTSYNVTKSNFQWRTTFAFSHNKDTWVERAPTWVPKIYENVKDPIRSVYQQKADGILQVGEPVPAAQPLLRPGQIKIKDVDGLQRNSAGNPVVGADGRFILTGQPDGRIDEADTKLVGQEPTRPNYSVGLQNIISYKNFSLNFDFNGLLGRRLADPNFLSFGLNPSSTNNTLRTVLNRWTPTNPSTTHPSAFGSNYGRGDFFMRNGSFFRLNDVMLGYTLGTKQLGNLAKSLQINVSANNLFIITGYKGIDPETDAYAAAYPNVKTFSLGLTASF
ncbi:MAG: TonB-dependent receptor [Bacteroidota bacterium]